jgi:hypothetical protein
VLKIEIHQIGNVRDGVAAENLAANRAPNKNSTNDAILALNMA